MIIVDVLASTEAFVWTVCLIAVRRSVSGQTGCRRCGRAWLQEHRQEVSQNDVRAYTWSTSRSLASEQNKSAVRSCYLPQLRHRLGSGQSHWQRKQQSGQMDQGGDTYQEGARQVDEQRRGVLSTLPHLRQPVRPESERQTVIRQTVPTKASVEVETSTIINKSFF